MKQLRRTMIWLLGGCTATIGCADAETLAPSAAVSTQTSHMAAQPAATKQPAEAAKKAAPATMALFDPPFPERLELFEPPKRAQSAVRRDDGQGETVELKGFVRVDEPRVVLSIDGVIAPIPEGGEKYGVQVIAIQPPSVVLQRGRNRWTATLE